MVIIHVETMDNVFQVMAISIVNVISDISEIDVNVSYKLKIFHMACGFQFA